MSTILYMAIPTFQKIVMVVALILLVICLIFVGIALYYHNYDDKYPPVLGSCPDYWDDVTVAQSNGETLGTSCKNNGINPPDGLEGPGCPGMGGIQSFTASSWQGDNGICNKAKWAKGCGVIWDGITNSNVDCDNNN